jgi:TBC1 domain family member 4
MECENRKNVTRQSENETKKLKLDYPDIQVYDEKQAVLLWENYINESKIVIKRDPKMLLDAIKNGVPRTKRGDVWLFLAKQQEIGTTPIDISKFPHFNESYEKLLKNLTEHQHAIFIDLGKKCLYFSSRFKKLISFQVEHFRIYLFIKDSVLDNWGYLIC